MTWLAAWAQRAAAREPSGASGGAASTRLPRVEILLALVLFAASCLSILLTRTPGDVALFWPASIIAAGVLIRQPDARWTSAAVLIWLAVFLADALVARTTWQAAGVLACISVAEIALMVTAFRVLWRFPYPDISVAHATFMTALMGVALPGLASLGVGFVLSHASAQPFGQSALRWWSADTLGTCLLGPAIVLAGRRALRRLLRPRFRLANIAILLTCLLATYLAIRYLRFPLVLLGVLLLTSAFRLGGFGTAVLSLASGLLISALWAMGMRPIGLEAAGAGASLQGLPVLALLAAVMPPVTVGIGADARRAAASALRASERHFREAMEYSPIGILVSDLDGTWRHCNRALCSMLGYSADELRALGPGGPSAAEEWEASRARWQRLLSGESHYYDVERRFLHKDGHWVWTHVAVSLMRNPAGAPLHLIAQIESLEARRDAAERLAEERERLTTILRSINDAVITTDAELRVTYVNAAAESLLGVSQSEVRGRRVDELLHLTDAQTLKTAANLVLKTMASGEAASRERGCVLHCADGRVRYVRDSVFPVAAAGGVLVGTVIVLRDISDEMDREQDLHRRASRDSLTGLLTPGEFRQRLRTLLEKARHKEWPAALLAIDLDRFKVLNDTAGHAAGDAMLCRVADACRAVVRSADTIGRLGGDEFAMVLENCAPDQAHATGRALRRLLNPLALDWQGTTYTVGASIGVAVLSAEMRDEQEWLSAADRACYRAKRSGRGQLRFESLAEEGDGTQGA